MKELSYENKVNRVIMEINEKQNIIEELKKKN